MWMSETPLDPQKTYILKHTTQSVRVQVDHVRWRKDLDTLQEVPAATLELNDIGRVALSTHRALFFDPYTENRQTGAFVLIDSLTNDTVGAGMIVGGAEGAEQDLDAALKELRAGSGLTPKTQVSPRERFERMGQKGAVVWLVGRPGSGRWSLAYALERRLFDLGRTATVVDPTDEDLRSMLSAAKAGADAGLVTVCAFPTHQRADRKALREKVGSERLVVVYVNTDEKLCRERRPDADHDAFEAPQHPDVTVALDQVRLDEAAETILDVLAERGQFAAATVR